MDNQAKGGRLILWLIAVLGSGALFYFGTGLAPLAALAWFAPFPVLFAAPRISSVAAGSAAFLGYFLGTINSWGFYLHSQDVPLPMGAAISAGGALAFLIVVVVYRALILRGRAFLAVVGAPAIWVGLLFLVARYNPVGVVGTLATTQTAYPVVLQTATVTGFWGIEFLVLFGPCLLAALIAPAEVSSASRIRSLVLGVLLAGVVIGGGYLRLAIVHPSGPAQRVALVATNNTAWAPDVTSATGQSLLDSYAQRIGGVPAGTQLVVLPEGSFTANGGALTTLSQSLGAVAQQRNLTIVVGVIQQSGGSTHNLALTITPSGDQPGTYVKEHDRVAVHGTQLSFARFDGTTFGVEICADVNFPDPSRSYAADGARLLAVPASDDNQDGWQHSRSAQLRGVENGVAVAWSDRNGELLISDGFGRVLAQAHTGGPGAFTVVSADVAPGPGETPYTRWGDWFAWFSAGLGLLALIGACLPAGPGRRGPKKPAGDTTTNFASFTA